MGTLHLVPVVVLGVVFLWLLWPVIGDSIQRGKSARIRAKHDSADQLADTLFGEWAEKQKT